MGERERERDEMSLNDGTAPSISSASTDAGSAQRNIDLLFDHDQDATAWEPARPPDVLGEFLDSRYMLPLLLPSDPRMLSASPKPPAPRDDAGRGAGRLSNGHARSESRASRRSSGSLPWQMRTRRLREVGADTLQWVDGAVASARWTRPVAVEIDEEDEEDSTDEDGDELRSLAYQYPEDAASAQDEDGDGDLTITTETRRVTPLTAKPSLRRGRTNTSAGITPVEPHPPK